MDGSGKGDAILYRVVSAFFHWHDVCRFDLRPTAAIYKLKPGERTCAIIYPSDVLSKFGIPEGTIDHLRDDRPFVTFEFKWSLDFVKFVAERLGCVSPIRPLIRRRKAGRYDGSEFAILDQPDSLNASPAIHGTIRFE